MNILPVCPECGLASDEIRCPRCNTVKIAGCSGSCMACALSGKGCTVPQTDAGTPAARENPANSADEADTKR